VAPPSVPVSVWLLAAFDPVLILVAVWLGWKADQLGKVFIAAIAALAASVLVSWLLTSIGIPWVAPVRADLPTLFPVRIAAALIWAGGTYAVRRMAKR
jgi:hypothetical protein